MSFRFFIKFVIQITMGWHNLRNKTKTRFILWCIQIPQRMDLHKFMRKHILIHLHQKNVSLCNIADYVAAFQTQFEAYHMNMSA